MSATKRDPKVVQSRVVYVRVTVSEHEYIKYQAQRAGLGASEWMRRLAMGSVRVVSVSESRAT